MAATVITAYSVELNQGPPGQPNVYLPLRPNQFMGRVRLSTFTVQCAAEASGSTYALCKIPNGGRIISGQIIASATLANSATISIGLMGADATGFIDSNPTGATVPTTVLATPSTSTVSDSKVCLKAAAALSTTLTPFAITQALGFLYAAAKDLYLTATTGTGAVTTEVITGYVLWSLD